MAGTAPSRTGPNSKVTEPAYVREDLEELKKDLERWRQLLFPLRRLLTWEQNYHPAVLFGTPTLVFLMVWFLEPSVMTTVGVLGLLITVADFSVLFISPYIYSTEQWTEEQEQEFEDMCRGILQWRVCIQDCVQELAILKAERPTVYFLLVMGLLTSLAWIGYIMNNLFLTYLIVLTVVMFPGLKQKGWIHRYMLKYWFIFKRLVFGRLPVFKSKVK